MTDHEDEVYGSTEGTGAAGDRRGPEAEGPPSAAARERLASAIRREVSGAEDELTEDLILSLLLLDAGRVADAERVVDRRRRRLHDLASRVDAVVASAAAEREAEFVVAAASTDVSASPGSMSGPSRVGFTERLRTLATSAAVIAAIVTAVAVTQDGPSAPQLVAGRSGQVTVTAGMPGADDLTSTGTDPRATDDATSGAATEGERRTSVRTPRPNASGEELAGPADGLGVLRLIGPSGDLLARLASDARRTSVVATLLGVEELVSQLVPAAESLPTEDAVPLVPDDDAEAQAPEGPDADPSPEPSPQTEPAPEPSTEPAPEPDSSSAEEPTDEATSSEDPETDADGDNGPDVGGWWGPSDDSTGDSTGDAAGDTADDTDGIVADGRLGGALP